MNKTIADAIKISIKTVEAHRARVMEKMDARSLADLVQRVMKAGNGSGKSLKACSTPSSTAVAPYGPQ